MIRKAVMEDIPKIQKMLEVSARKGELLARPLGELYDSVRDFVVYQGDKKQVVGCCAMHPSWENLGEIRSLVVIEGERRQGIGRLLVTSCLDDARDLGIRNVFVLTYNSGFFGRLGFSPISKNHLPHKIWTDCIRCVHFPDCKEEALSIQIDPKAQDA